MGSYIETTIGDAVTNDMITGGTFSVEDNSDGTKVLKFDFTTESGASCKYYYEGDVELNTESAVYPVGDVQPTDVISVSAAYNGAADDAGSLCNIDLTLLTAAMIAPSTIISFNMPFVEFSEDIDLSGTYEAIGTPMSAAGINKGVDMTTFAAEYFIADGESTMTLTKNADGTYDIKASLKNAAGESYDYDIKGMAIELSDWSSMDDEDYGEDW